MPLETLGQRLRQARQALGWTQDELAKPEFTKGFISQLERDLVRPSVTSLESLARKLGQPISYFVGTEAVTAQKVLDAFDSRGRLELARQRYDVALITFTEMRDLAAAQAQPALETRGTLGVGEALLGIRRLEEARPALEEALTRGRAAGDPLVECRALHGLATVEHRSGRFTQAAGFYRDALAVVPALNGTEPMLHGEIWLYLGTVLFRLGRLDEAASAYVQAARLLDDAHHPERVGEALLGTGMVLMRSGDYDGALLQYERARARFEQYEDLQMLSYVRNNLGMVLASAGRPAEALEHLTASLAIKRRLQDLVGECHTLTELARCQFEAGALAQARETAALAITTSRAAGAPDEEALASLVLGLVAIAEGELRKARRYLERAAAHCQAAGMTLDLVTVFYELARLAVLQRRFKAAATYHEQAFAALRAVGPHDVVRAIRLAELPEQRVKAPAGGTAVTGARD